MKWVAAAREAMRGVFLRRRADEEMEEEMRFHLDLETARLIHDGLDPEEARRRANVMFGGVEKHKEHVRIARGLNWVSGMSLDLKLGLRMLVKYPGLAIVGGLGMAVAIAIGAGFFAFMHSYAFPSALRLDEGDRIRGIKNWDIVANDSERRSMHDFFTWRAELKSIEDLAAFRFVRRNFIMPDGGAELVHVAEMTASAFRLARVPPILGRPLIDDDERTGAPRVVVIGEEVWRTRFNSSPNILGRQIRLGNALHTVVGVMPAGFAYPMNFRFWTALQADPRQFAPREGPEILILGRLAPGVSEEEAGAELAALGQRTARDHPRSHAQLRPRIVPFVDLTGFIETADAKWKIYLLQLLVSLLLVVVAVNVGILVYARTVMRHAEIAVRSALGASRIRIVTQLFIEALVLAGVAAMVGLAIAAFVHKRLHQLLINLSEPYGGLPFWMDPGFSSGTIVYAIALAIVGAAIVGVSPALKATGRQLQAGIRNASTARLGKTWTVLIIAQVAIAVAVLPVAIISAWQWAAEGFAQPGFPAGKFVTARIEMDRDDFHTARAELYERAFSARYEDRLTALMTRLEREPGVADVTFAMEPPGAEPTAAVEVDGARATTTTGGHPVRFNRIDVGFFDAFDVPLISGRSFGPADLGAGAIAVVVNRAFAEDILGGGNAVGRRVRYVSKEEWDATERVKIGPWYEIVGVVGNLPPNPLTSKGIAARIYHPAAAGTAHPASLAIRFESVAPEAFSGPLHQIAASLDPTLRPHEVLRLDKAYREGEQGVMRIGAGVFAIVTLSVLLLSAAGIYALMSFIVIRRRREIGIRAALGADPRRLLGNIFSRALGQLAAGVSAGAVIAALVVPGIVGDRISLPAVIAAVAAIIMTVGVLAVVGPARRSLRIQPTEALRME